MDHKLTTYYKFHSKIYDLTRWSFLFGRKRLLASLPALPDGATIIDIGCGTGFHLPQLAQKFPEAHIIGMDLSADMLHKAAMKCDPYPNIELRNTAYNMSTFDANSIDLAMCSYSLSMIDEPAPILDSINAHLKPTGAVAVLDFKATSYSWFAKWMSVNHVDFDSQLFSLLDDRFDTQTSFEKGVYSNLWNFGLFVGTKLSAS